MFRFVDNLRALAILSTAWGGLAFVAIVFFGAPPVTYFYAVCAFLAFTWFAQNRHNREMRGRR